MKTSKILSKDWVNRSYVLDEYPIGDSSYDNRVKTLDTESYSGYTQFIGKFKERYIHKSILDTIFLPKRLPNRNQPHQVRKWVRKHKWNYFGNITPLESDISTNIELTNKIFRKLKSRHADLILFYSMEQNPCSNNLYHTHFLIKTEDHIKIKEIISQIKQDTLLKEFLFPREIKTNSRIQIDPYDHDLFYKRGLHYVLKYDIKIGLMR